MEIDEIKLSKCYSCSRIREMTFKKSSRQYGRIIFWCTRKNYNPNGRNFNGCDGYRTLEEQKIISQKMTKSFKKWKVKKKKKEQIKEQKRHKLERDFCNRCLRNARLYNVNIGACPEQIDRAIDSCSDFIDATETLIRNKIEQKSW